MRLLFTAFACLISLSVLAQSPCNNQTSVTYQEYEYDIVEIGDQCWFSENCRYLPNVSQYSSSSTTTPYYYVYGYNGTNVTAAKETANFANFGVLYNWPAVMRPGVCPSGWHIPTDIEWHTLEMALGMSASDAYSTGWRGSPVGAQMKSTTGWIEGGNGTNSSGFNGVPGGYQVFDGFYSNGNGGHWWSSSESGSNSWERTLGYYNGTVHRYSNDRYYGFSARCLSDYSTTISVPTEPSSNRKLVKVIDALGREVNLTPNQILFYLYDDGSVEKTFVVE